MRIAFVAVGLALLTLLSSCAGEPPTAEERIRTTFREIERASRVGDMAALKDFVSPGYADPRGRTVKDLHSLITYHYFRHKKVYLLTRLESLAISAPDAATVTVLGAMASAPIPEPSALRNVHADVYRFDLVLAGDDDGAWRVTSGEWRPARLDDFL